MSLKEVISILPQNAFLLYVPNQQLFFIHFDNLSILENNLLIFVDTHTQALNISNPPLSILAVETHYLRLSFALLSASLHGLLQPPHTLGWAFKHLVSSYLLLRLETNSSTILV